METQSINRSAVWCEIYTKNIQPSVIKHLSCGTRFPFGFKRLSFLIKLTVRAVPSPSYAALGLDCRETIPCCTELLSPIIIVELVLLCVVFPPTLNWTCIHTNKVVIVFEALILISPVATFKLSWTKKSNSFPSWDCGYWLWIRLYVAAQGNNFNLQEWGSQKRAKNISVTSMENSYVTKLLCSPTNTPLNRNGHTLPSRMALW